MTKNLVTFCISGMIIHTINFSKIFGYVLNGLPKSDKAALCGCSDHTIARSHLVRFNFLEIVRCNKNQALKLKYVSNRIIKAS